MRRALRWWWLALGALALVAGAPAAIADDPPEGPPGRIAFDSNRGGDWHVYLANADGSVAQLLTSTPGWLPAWSPDATRIAFTDGEGVYVATADGKAVRQVTKGVDQAWSPDGTQLVFMHKWAIHVVNADGSGDRQLTSEAENDAATLAALPAWSPDGKRIAYETMDGLFVVNADGSGKTRLSTWGVDVDGNARPQWSPDGSSIAFLGDTCCVEGDVEFFERRTQVPTLSVVDVGSGSAHVVARDVGEEFSWSPDGTMLAFSRQLGDADDSPSEIFVAPASGGGAAGAATRVTVSKVGESSWAPSWSPDGRWLAYMHGRLPARFWSGSADVAIIGVDGSGGRDLTQPFPSGGRNYDPVWAEGTVPAQPEAPAATLVEAPGKALTSKDVVYEVAASGKRAAALSSSADVPVFWTPPAAGLTPAGGVDLESGDYYGLVMGSEYAAWFSTFAHGLSEPVTEVSLVLTSVSTKRSLVLDTIEREDHNPDYETGPRLAADGQLIVYNPDLAGSKLFRVDMSGKKPQLRLIAKRLAVEAVDQGRIAGWRGDAQLVTLRADGHVLGKAALSRKATTSLRLDGARLFTTAGNRLSLRSLNGKVQRSWPLADEGGGAPWLAGVEGDIAVYVSGVAVHVLRLSSGADVVLELPSQGPEIDVELTSAGLFYGYNAAYVKQPGRLGFVSMAGLAGVVAA